MSGWPMFSGGLPGWAQQPASRARLAPLARRGASGQRGGWANRQNAARCAAVVVALVLWLGATPALAHRGSRLSLPEARRIITRVLSETPFVTSFKVHRCYVLDRRRDACIVTINGRLMRVTVAYWKPPRHAKRPARQRRHQFAL